MRSTTPALAAFLATRPTMLWVCDLFSFTLASGAALNYASGDADVNYAGKTWYATGALSVDRSTWSGKDTLDIPTMEITISSDGTDFGATNFKTMLHNGGFDGASVQLDRAIGAEPGIPLGLVTLFAGPIGAITLGALTAKITVKGWTVVLQQYMPRNVYQTACTHSLYDANCTVNRAAHTATNTVLAAVRNTIGTNPNSWILPGGATAPVANLIGGTLTITSGVSAGARRTIIAAVPTAVGFTYPLYAIPAPGDTLTCTYGCDKTAAACARFGNLQHIRSFPFVPPAEKGI